MVAGTLLLYTVPYITITDPHHLNADSDSIFYFFTEWCESATTGLMRRGPPRLHLALTRLHLALTSLHCERPQPFMAPLWASTYSPWILTWMWIRNPATIMRTQIQFANIKRIHAVPDPQQWYDSTVPSPKLFSLEHLKIRRKKMCKYLCTTVVHYWIKGTEYLKMNLEKRQIFTVHSGLQTIYIIGT